ncbi:MAG: Rieske 2Fe-2S domain-containing protein [Dehalococcoidia bacterium]
MLSIEENDLVTKTGAGTPMGDLYRRFWVPVLLADELPVPDCTPVRVQVMGEHLIAFKDTNGRIGLLDRRCPHRSANLFFGRNEEGGLRCAYHGWKYDVDGNCLDIPNAPEGASFKDKITTFAAYPAVERGGLVWAYLGPKELQPPFPEFELNQVPESHRYITKVFLDGNWLQHMEGEIDSSHVGFLHSRIDSGMSPLQARGRMGIDVFKDQAPTWVFKDTDYGIMLGALRKSGEGKNYWRVNQWIMPSFTMIAAKPGTPVHLQMRVPIDDEHSIFFRAIWHPTRPLTEEELHDARDVGVNFPELLPGEFRGKENMGNDYLIDRAVQRTTSFTGIKSIPAQDWAMQESMGGPVPDRSIEHLVSADAAIIAVRKRLLKTLQDLQEGLEPAESQAGTRYGVRSIDIMLEPEATVWEDAKEYLEAQAW